MYLWNGHIHPSDTKEPLEVNTGQAGLKRLMEETATRNAEDIHYSASTGVMRNSGYLEEKAGERVNEGVHRCTQFAL